MLAFFLGMEHGGLFPKPGEFRLVTNRARAAQIA